MNTRKILFGTFAILILAISACTSSTAEEDALYENGVDKNDVIIDKVAVDKGDIDINRVSVDKNDIKIND